jgi:hypothetical protein
MGIRDSFPGSKAVGGELTIHLHLVSRSKNEWSYNPLPQYAFMAWCLVKAQGQLYLFTFSNLIQSHCVCWMENDWEGSEIVVNIISRLSSWMIWKIKTQKSPSWLPFEIRTEKFRVR